MSTLSQIALAGFIASLVLWKIFPLTSLTNDWEWRLVFPIVNFLCLAFLLVKLLIVIVEVSS